MNSTAREKVVLSAGIFIAVIVNRYFTDWTIENAATHQLLLRCINAGLFTGYGVLPFNAMRERRLRREAAESKQE